MIKVSYQRGGEVKTASKMTLEVLGVPFGGPEDGKDLEDEYFSPKTDLALEIGDARPVFVDHGQTGNPEQIGRAEAVRRDSRGVWFRVALDKASQLAKDVFERAKQGLIGASSGALNYLTDKADDGEILRWPMGELSLIDLTGPRLPANSYAVVRPMKHLTDVYMKDLEKLNKEVLAEKIAEAKLALEKNPPHRVVVPLSKPKEEKKP